MEAYEQMRHRQCKIVRKTNEGQAYPPIPTPDDIQPPHLRQFEYPYEADD